MASHHPCTSCGGHGPFSKAQKAKGIYERRCADCVGGGGGSRMFECGTCNRTFRDENALQQHSVTHRERTFPCPGCGKKYRGMTDTAIHFESGACNGCRGEDNARRATYQLVQGQSNGRSFLTSPLMLTDGSSGGGYSADGPNYKCPACSRQFTKLSSLMQHTQNRPSCQASGTNVNLRLGPASSSTQRLKFFHGTTWDAACAIEGNGFMPSEGGCLGHGVYVARQDKATRFAQERADENYDPYGGLVELVVTFSNPKYVLSNDYGWQSEGYDACRAERTSASTNMEWCILSPDQIEVVGVEAVYV